jgi:hypothetical protein
MRGPFVTWVAVFTGLLAASGAGYASSGAGPSGALATNAPAAAAACANLPACTTALADTVASAGSPSDLCACHEGNAGALAYVDTTKILWACVGHDWTAILQDVGTPGPTGARTAGAFAPQGGAGAESFVLVTPMGAGTRCPCGGEEIRVGVDTNGDGALEGNEVQRSYGVCDTSAMASKR